ncbi:MAG: putative metal-dependent hydrolase, partial [Sphingobacteriales bacterium]
MDPRFPIGKYEAKPFSAEQKEKWLTDILFLPRQLEMAILNLDEQQLETPYREEGWTVRQVIHHVADSHMNAFIRCKLGLTETNPTIKPYEEALWAEQSDYKLAVNISLTLLHALHNRWYDLLKHMKDEEWNRTVIHPQHNKQMTLWFLLGMYAWHGHHHTAHITSLRERMG